MSTEQGLTLLVGGARSGKSALAEQIGHRHERSGGSVVYVATAPIIDDDMASRVARHRDDRPETWLTIEEEIDLVGALRETGDALVIIDCLTLWVSNLMWRDRTDAEITDVATRTAEVAGRRSSPTVVVSNEVGLGVHPETELGRDYRDTLGRVNQVWAREAETTLFLAAGRAMRLDDPLDLI